MKMTTHAFGPAIFVATPAIAQDAAAVGAAMGGIAGLVILIGVGAFVGWLASVIVKGGGSGLLMDTVIGIGGAILAGYLLPAMGIELGNIIGSLIAALVGAVLLILLVRLIQRVSG